MKSSLRWALPLPALATGCAAPSVEQRRAASATAVTALQRGAFDKADGDAGRALATDAGNPTARVVRAIARYKKAGHQLSLDIRTGVIGGLAAGGFNQRYLRSALEQAERDFAAVEEDLAVAARDPGISLELCLACWEMDWNGNGRVDERDRLLMQIEVDERGERIPDDDPRRKPTFRFDHGDVAWARAFVSFQRAAIDLVLAYDLSAVNTVVQARSKQDAPETIVLPLIDRGRIAAARERILEGLRRSEESRRAYLAEGDDDREWVPNPTQVNHPMPLPANQALYDTWAGVVGDVERIVRGDEGLAVSELVRLDEAEKRSNAKGFLDLGRMLSEPHAITLRLADLDELEHARDLEKTLRSVFGEFYVPTMKASPLPGRLLRMKSDIDRREESLERKLRYLFWIN